MYLCVKCLYIKIIIGRLQRGETITLEDGRIIEPSQVVGPSSPGHVSKNKNKKHSSYFRIIFRCFHSLDATYIDKNIH